MRDDNIDAIRQRSAAEYRDIRGERNARAATHDVETLLAALDCLQRKLQIRWQDLPGTTAELVDAAPEGMRQLMRQWVDEFSELRGKLASVTAELDALSQDDGKVERALESKQAECDRLTQQVAATTAAYDRINGRCLGFMDQVGSIARFLDCGHCEIDIIAAVKSIRDERDVFTAALAEVRGESVSLENMRRDLNNHKRYVFADHPLQPTDGKALLAHTDALLSLVNSLQLAEAANRNGFAQAKAREQGLRERVAELEKSMAHWQHCHGVTADALGAAESRARELQKVCSTARDTLGYLADMHQLSPSDAMHVAELRSALASSLSPPPTEHNPLDCEQCWLPHGDPQS